MEKFYTVVPSPNRPWEVVEVDDALHPPCERLESAWKLLAGLAAGIRDAAKMIKGALSQTQRLTPRSPKQCSVTACDDSHCRLDGGSYEKHSNGWPRACL